MNIVEGIVLGVSVICGTLILIVWMAIKAMPKK